MKRHVVLSVAFAFASLSLAASSMASNIESRVFAPNIPLLNAETREVVSLKNEIAKANHTIVLFVSSECLDSIHLAPHLDTFLESIKNQSIRVIGINSHQKESPAQISIHRRALGLDIPIYKDTEQILANYLRARYSSDYFVFDQNGALVQQGQLQETQIGNLETHLGQGRSFDAFKGQLSSQHPTSTVTGCPIMR